MERCNILLLDDDEDDYQLLKSYIHEAFNAKVILDWFQRDGFSNVMICSGYYLLTLVNCQLGDETGQEIIRKAKEKCPDQVIFLLTSWDPCAFTDQRALQAGADRVLRKAELSTGLVKKIISPHLVPRRCPELPGSRG